MSVRRIVCFFAWPTGHLIDPRATCSREACHCFLRAMVFALGTAILALHCIEGQAPCGGNPNLDPENACARFEGSEIIEEKVCPAIAFYYGVAPITEACQLTKNRPDAGTRAFSEDASGGYEYRLMADIFLSSSDNFIPWGKVYDDGKNDLKFSATFNGNGHSISNLKIKQTGEDDVGFFAHIAKTGVVKNLTLIGAKVRAKDNVGAIAGQNEGRIENVIVKSSSRRASFVGGNKDVGGVVGFNNGGTLEAVRLMNSDNKKSQVIGLVNVGGLVGRSLDGLVAVGCGASDTSNDCHSTQLIDLQGNALFSAQTLFESRKKETKDGDDAASFSEGEVLAKTGPVGGIVGLVERSDTASSVVDIFGVLSRATLRQAVCEENPDDFGMSHLACKIQSKYQKANGAGDNELSQAGGVIGYLKGEKARIRASYAWVGSEVKAHTKVGGLVGHSEGIIEYSGSEAKNCKESPMQDHDDGRCRRVLVSGRKAVGGLIGQVKKASGAGAASNDAKSIVSKSYSKAQVKAYDPEDGDTKEFRYFGAMIGHLNTDREIKDSYAEGLVKAARANDVGGLVGAAAGGATLTHVYASVEVSGKNRVGALVGRLGYHPVGYKCPSVVDPPVVDPPVVDPPVVDPPVVDPPSVDPPPSSASIAKSYADGIVKGVNEVGGLVGRLDKGLACSTDEKATAIDESYANAKVQQSDEDPRPKARFGGLVGYKAQLSFIKKSYSVSRLHLHEDNTLGNVGSAIGFCAPSSGKAELPDQLYALFDTKKALGSTCSVYSGKIALRSLAYLRDLLYEEASSSLGWPNDWNGVLDSDSSQLNLPGKYPCLGGVMHAASRPFAGDCEANGANIGTDGELPLCEGYVATQSPPQDPSQLLCHFRETPGAITKLQYMDDISLAPPSSLLSPPTIIDDKVYFYWDYTLLEGLERGRLTQDTGLRFQLIWREIAKNEEGEDRESCSVTTPASDSLTNKIVYDISVFRCLLSHKGIVFW